MNAVALPSTLITAQALVDDHGLPVFPCSPKKSPVTTNGLHDASRDPVQIDGWWTKYPGALIGVPTGLASGIWVLDIDPAGANWYRDNADKLDCACIHKTMRGHHLLYTLPDFDVRNSAGKIAPGIDVRGTGGYVIWWPAHGLETVGSLDDIGPAPDWLLALLNPAPVVKPVTSAAIHEGGRNDSLARLAGMMRKAGATQEELIAGLQAFNATRCSPRLPDSEVEQIARSISRYTPEAKATRRKDSFDYVMAGRSDAVAPVPALVKKIIAEKSMIGLIGESGSGKSHVAAEIAIATATGGDFFGYQAQAGAVVYVAAEGSAGFLRRMAAAVQRGRISPDTPIAVVKQAAILAEGYDDQALLSTVLNFQSVVGVPVRLVVIDTLARSIAGDENTATDMGEFVKSCDLIRNETGAAVLVVHHAGKDATKGARGSSAFKAALDTEIKVEGTQNPRTFSVTKQRDMDCVGPFNFDLDPVVVGQDEDGDPITACEVRQTDQQPPKPKAKANGINQYKAMAAIQEWSRANPSAPGISSDDIRALLKAQDLNDRRRPEVLKYLVDIRALTPSVGGYTVDRGML